MKLASLVIAAMGTVVLACSPPTPPSSIESPSANGQAGPSVSNTSQADGMLVTLAISSGTVTAGGRISVRISALNAGIGPAAYSAGGCGPIMSVAVSGPPLAARPVQNPPAGTGGAAALQLAKWSALSQGGPQLDPVRTARIPDDAAFACTADLRYEDLDPGETFADDGVWIARIMDGAPAPAGAYTVALDFPFAGRVAKEDVGFDRDPVIPPIRVSVPLTVEPGPRVTVDAEAAIDAAIADPEVAAWAGRSLTREGLTGATITMVDGRWRFRIMHVGGQADAYVDPVTGEVVERHL